MSIMELSAELADWEHCGTSWNPMRMLVLIEALLAERRLACPASGYQVLIKPRIEINDAVTNGAAQAQIRWATAMHPSLPEESA